MRNENVWKISSTPNLMGAGCNEANAKVRPYYLNYIRKHFSGLTNKTWNVGYESDGSVCDGDTYMNP